MPTLSQFMHLLALERLASELHESAVTAMQPDEQVPVFFLKQYLQDATGGYVLRVTIGDETQYLVSDGTQEISPESLTPLRCPLRAVLFALQNGASQSTVWIIRILEYGEENIPEEVRISRKRFVPVAGMVREVTMKAGDTFSAFATAISQQLAELEIAGWDDSNLVVIQKLDEEDEALISRVKQSMKAHHRHASAN